MSYNSVRNRILTLEKMVGGSHNGTFSRRRRNKNRYAAKELSDKWAEQLVEYRDDILGYCDFRGAQLTAQQVRVAETLQREKRVLVPSGNGTGKSFLASLFASWHYDCWNPGETFVTAPNLKQVKDIVFKELRSLRHGDPHFYQRASRLQSSHNHFIDGLTARSATGFQGRHDNSIMVIFDEAEDIPKEFWQAAETMAHYWVAIYNPTTTGSEAAIQERSGHWPIVPLNALEHPNVARELSGQPPLIPSAVRLSEVRQRLRRWSRIVENPADRLPTDVELEGIVYRPGPAAEARVLGRRPTTSVDTVFSSILLDKLLKTRHDVQLSWPCQIGVDIARFGDDFTSIHGRKGFASLLHESFNGYDIVATAKRVEAAAVSLDSVYYRDIPIVTDDTCLGGGLTDLLRSWRFNVIPLNFGARGNFPDDYPNIRSEILFGFTDIVDRGLADISRLSPEVIEDLTTQIMAPKYTLDARGRRVVEPKEITKSRISRSPDDSDALCLAYYAAPEAIERYA